MATMSLVAAAAGEAPEASLQVSALRLNWVE